MTQNLVDRKYNSFNNVSYTLIPHLVWFGGLREMFIYSAMFVCLLVCLVWLLNICNILFHYHSPLELHISKTGSV